MILHVLRALFILLMAAVGWSFIKDPAAFGPYTWLNMAGVITASVFLVCLDILAPRKKLAVFSGTFLGLIVGISIAYGLSFVVPLMIDLYQQMKRTVLPPDTVQALTNYVTMVIGLVSCYLAISFILQTKDDFRFVIPYVEFSKQTKGARSILLDTSVLIDARINDIARSGIIESPLIVPRFVVQELQSIADGADRLKRNRGRRGLDTLADLKLNSRAELIDYDASGRVDPTLPVDEQLLQLATELGARVLTNDFNLNKVAGLRGVDVINLNDLSNALKPVVLPGEKMNVRLLKAGEEVGQGVGYLDDGTMVVVEGGRELISQDVEFTVTNTRQTTAGKMIFGRLGDEPTPPSRRRPRSGTPT